MTTAQVVETSVPVSNSHFKTTLSRTIMLHLLMQQQFVKHDCDEKSKA